MSTFTRTLNLVKSFIYMQYHMTHFFFNTIQ